MPDFNPFSIQQNNAVPSNPFWSGVVQGDSEREAVPFIQNAQQSQGLDLQKKAMEMGEFADPRSVRARMSGQDLTAIKNESEGRLTSTRENAESKKIEEELRALPHVTEAKIEQAKQMSNASAGTPYHALHGTLGALYPSIHNKPLAEQLNAYSGAVNQWKRENPHVQLPANFDPNGMMTVDDFKQKILPDMQNMHLGGLNTPDQLGKERIVGLQGANQQAEQGLRNTGSQTVAEINASAHIRGHEIAANSQETPPKAIARLRSELRKDPQNEGARTELNGYMQEKFNTDFSKDTMGQMLQAQAVSNPQKMNDFLVYKEQQKARLFMDEGLYGDIDGEGRSWVMRAIQANPNMGLDNVVKEGNKLGKLKKKK